jgi:polysaccharide export outer membrane protein
LPLIGEMNVNGLTALGLEKKLREAYDNYIYNPQVGVLIREFRQRVSVIGAVQKPGVFELTGPKSLIELLAMAGGVSDKAGAQVHIYRQGANGRETHVITCVLESTGLAMCNNAGMINIPVEPSEWSRSEAGCFVDAGAKLVPILNAVGFSWVWHRRRC